MYIFRWLMKHPVIILALYFLSIAAILYSMTRNSSIETGVTNTPQVQKVDSTEIDLSAAPKIEPSTLTSALVNEESSTEVANTDEVNAETAVTDSEESKATETSEETAKSESSSNETETTEATDVVVEEPATEEVALQQAASSTDQAQPDAQFSEMSSEELLLMAREAYWNNGLDESAQIYQQLIQLDPEILDYKGELGNVYWRQGFPKKAAELYAEISLPMIEEGNADKVANMVGFIGLFLPEKATEIHNLLQAKK
ncbi:MAG: hypothetical protein ACI88H_001586 [Cocleimonas sp.]|jgi:hypothetical protein